MTTDKKEDERLAIEKQERQDIDNWQKEKTRGWPLKK